MYEAHFGLSDLPFRIVPDLGFYLDSSPHHGAVDALMHGLARGDELLLLTGDAGVGKTTVVRKLLAEIDRDDFVVGEVSGSGLLGEDLLRAVASAFGVRGSYDADPVATRRQLQEQLRVEHREALLVIDEAQELDADSLGRLAELAAIPLDGAHGLHVCLVAQQAPPGLVELERLGQPLVVGTTCRLRPLEAAETREYVLRRLRQVGWTGCPAFSDAAMEAIHAQSEGIPARINLLANRLLLALYAQRATEVHAELVLRVDDLLKSELAGQALPGALSLAASLPDEGAEPSKESTGVSVATATGQAEETRMAPEPAWEAATSGPVGQTVPTAQPRHRTQGFTLDEFPVLHAPTREAAPPQAAADPAVMPVLATTQPPVSRSANDGNASTTDPGSGASSALSAGPVAERRVALSVRSPAGTTSATRSRFRRLFPTVAVLLAVAGLGTFWKILQTQEDNPAGGPAQSVAGTAASPGAEIRSAAVRSGVVTMPSAAVAPQPTQPNASGSLPAAAALPRPTAEVAAADVTSAPNAPAGTPAADRQLGTPPSGGAQAARTVAMAGVEAAPRATRPAALRDPAAPVALAPVRSAAGITATAAPAPLAEQPVQNAAGEPVRGSIPVAACTAAAQTLGLCVQPPANQTGREGAPSAQRESAPPPCEPSRAALGLCADR